MDADGTFAGDVLLEVADGTADMVVTANAIHDCRTFDTAVVLSLFGGNDEDDGKSDGKTWWGNCIGNTSKAERIESRFQHITHAMGLSSAALREAEKAASMDLAWMKDEGIADEITCTGSILDRNSFSLIVLVKKSGNTVFTGTYGLQWQEGLYGVRE